MHWEIAKKNFEHNSYVAHPENLLYCCYLCPWSSDEDRQEALVKILEFRKTKMRSKAKKPRQFVTPLPHELNLAAATPMKMINWEIIARKLKTDLPIFQKLSYAEIPLLLEPNNTVKDKIPSGLLCHSQPNEFYVQLATKVLSKYVKNRKARIVSTVKSRRKFPYTIRNSMTRLIFLQVGINMFLE